MTSQRSLRIRLAVVLAIAAVAALVAGRCGLMSSGSGAALAVILFLCTAAALFSAGSRTVLSTSAADRPGSPYPPSRPAATPVRPAPAAAPVRPPARPAPPAAPPRVAPQVPPAPAPPQPPVADRIEADDKLVGRGAVVAVDFDENSTAAPTNIATYRTVRHGQMDFSFAVVRLRSSSYRIYIMNHPSYGIRSRGAHETHRLQDPRGRHYVCWTDRIPTARAAMAIGGEWAELTVRYILTGTRIEAPDPTAARHDELVQAQFHSRAR